MLQFSIITITSFVTALDEIAILIARSVNPKANFKKIIPILSILFGVALGIGGYFTPNVDMGENLIEAIFVGLSAGAAATGVNQVSKQLSKDAKVDEYIDNVNQFTDFINNVEVPADEEVQEVDEATNDTEDIVEEEEEPTEPIVVESILDEADEEVKEESEEEAIVDLDSGEDKVEEV